MGLQVCHAGDALSAAIDGGFAGIIVDLFSGTDVLECLKEASVYSHTNKVEFLDYSLIMLLKSS